MATPTSMENNSDYLAAKQEYERQLREYDRQSILPTWLYPDYTETRESLIKKMEGHIANGTGDIERCRQYLDEIKASPPGPILDPAEPRGLTLDVYRRIEVLKDELASHVDPYQELNVKAILQEYRSGRLQIEPGKASYWKNGRIKRPFGPELSEKEFLNCHTEWNREEEQGRIFEEMGNEVEYE